MRANSSTDNANLSTSGSFVNREQLDLIDSTGGVGTVVAHSNIKELDKH